MASSSRQYELVLLGATGYTGNLTAEYIQEHVRTDLKWAIAGRNGKRLAEIAAELKTLNPDRIQPEIEVVELKSEQLRMLAKKTKVLITTVGPYWKYGTPVVEACAESATHYLDVTGESPWTYDMLQRYHETAKKNGVVVSIFPQSFGNLSSGDRYILPQCGIDSVPADLLAYLTVREIRNNLDVGVTSCINSLQKISGSVSGGTAMTAITLVEAYPLKFLAKAMKPFALSSVPPPKETISESIFTKLLGYRNVPDLGILTDSPQSGSDIPIVNRSWSLFSNGDYYGRKFSFSEWLRVKSKTMGSIVHYIMTFSLVMLYFRPFRWYLKRLVYQPGQGATKEEASTNEFSYKAIATADHPSKQRAVGTFYYKGSGYYMTGILLAEAALLILRGDDVLAKRLCGMVTPATLEMEYVERLRKAGIKIEARMMD